jgi:Fic family protein
MSQIRPLQQLDPARFEAAPILKALNCASRQLAELKGVASVIPNQGILIHTLGIQEAKDSSEIENIVTTQDELYKEDALPASIRSAASKEVYRYSEALAAGYATVSKTGLISTKALIAIQSQLMNSSSGIRTMPGTNLVDGTGRLVYQPPQSHEEILSLMTDLESFINLAEQFPADPLIKMALIHHQFESIHPFYDGNGRTGRILNALYLVKEKLLDIPILYLSQPLLQSKAEYYRTLQDVRDSDDWEGWVMYMLGAIAASARQGILTISQIEDAILKLKHDIRERHRFYSQDLLNNLFSHPYTKIDFIMRDLNVSRLTATRYLDALVGSGFLEKRKVGRNSYYVNTALVQILAAPPSL